MAVAGYQYRKKLTSEPTTWGSPVDVGLPSPLEYLVAGLAADTSYDFQIRAYDDSGNYSAWSTPAVTEATDPATVALDSIAGLVGWWKGDAIVGLANNDPVPLWPDSSSANNDAVEVAPSQNPILKTNQIDGHNVVHFSGGGQVLVTPAMAAIAAWTVFLVVKSGNSSLSAFLSADNINTIFQALTSDHIGYSAGGGADTQIATIDTAHYQIITCDIGSLPSGGHPIYIGSSTTGGGYTLLGDIAEIALYNVALAAPNKLAAKASLAAKYPSAIVV